MNPRSPSSPAPRPNPATARAPGRSRHRRAAGALAVRDAVERATPPAGWVEPLEGRQLLSAAALLYSTGQPIPLGRADAPAITATRKGNDDGGNKDKSSPSASISAPDVHVAGGTTATVTVVYRDDVAVRRSKIGKSDLRISPGLSVKNVTVDRGDDGSPLVAVYTVAARGGRWGREDNGTYSVSVKAGEVADTSGNAVAATTATFAVSISAAQNQGSDDGGGVDGGGGDPAPAPEPTPVPSADGTPPAATITCGDVTAPGAAPHVVTVTYSDDVALNLASIDAADLAVTGPGGAGVPVAAASAQPGAGGTTVTATYTLAPPGGTWDAADDGSYTVALVAGQVSDAAGNAAAAAPQAFDVAVPPADTTPPAVSISASDIGSAGGTTQTITVIFADDGGGSLDAGGIGVEDLTVARQGAAGGGNLAVTGVSVSGGSGNAVTATYTVAAPGGGWDAGDNGTYSVTLAANTVRDAAGNGNAQTGGAFQVAVPAPDTTRPTASITAPDVTVAGNGPHTITVVYSDNVALDLATIGRGDLRVSKAGPGGADLTVGDPTVAPGGTGASLTVTYPVTGPGGSWLEGDNGAYNVTVVNNEVRDASGNAVAATNASFRVNIPHADTTGPIASIAAPSITSAGGNGQVITVTYSDESGIDENSVGADDITVSGPGGNLVVTGAGPAGRGAQSRTFIYTVAAPGGSWDFADNGTYAVAVNTGAVRDAAGNGNAAAGGTFGVNVPRPDTAGPGVSISAAGITSAGGNGQVVTVTYADDGGIDAASIGADDISVSGPGGGLAVTGFSAAGGGGTTRTVIYTVAAPGGTWDSSDNGTYTVSVHVDAVRDAAGNGNAAADGTFGVNIAAPPPPPPPQDTTRPTVTSITAPDVGSAGGAGTTIIVVFGDDVALDASTISADDLAVSHDGSALSVTGVTRSPDANAGAVTATFTVAAPGGSWDAADNGTYAVALAGDVRDTAGNAVANGATATFRVDVAAPDVTGPAVASISAPNIITAGRDRQTITVTFTDPSGVARSSVSKDDLTVTGPGGAALKVRGVDLSPADADATSLTATYTVDAPKGGWGHDDNGTYTIALAAGKVRDTAGNAGAAASATFTVSIDAPQQPDTAAPTVTSIAAPDLNNATAGQTVTVIYADDRGIDLSSIDANDITVTGPAGNLTVGGVVTSGGGTSVTAVYTIAGPGGSFDFADNGSYTVTLNAGQVRDTAGNAAAGGAGATFQVNVTRQDGRAPTADSVAAADVSLAGGNTQDIVISYSDDLGIDLESVGDDDVTVTRPGGGGTLPIDNVRIAGSGANVTVTYTVTPPGGTWDAADNGTYAVVVNAGKVRDASGKGVGRATGSFAVSVPDPGPADPDFGGGETVPTPAFTIEAIANQADGRILAAGRQGSLAGGAGGAQAVIERFNADGTLDTTFGVGGKVVADGDEVYYAIVQQDANHVLAAGTRGGDFVVARYDNAGHLDASFGDGGRMRIDFGTARDGAYALAVAPDGRIVVGGSSDGNFAFARLGASGDLDFTFAQGGKQLFDMGTAADEIGALLVQADGRVVAAGSSGTDVIVLRLGADGEADPAFSGDGVLVVPGLAARDDPSLPDRSQGLAIQPDGKLLLANRTAGGDFGLARIDGSGNLDSGFGTNGIATADFGGEDDADAVLVQEAGQILVVGTTDAGGGTPKTGVAAFDPSGRLIAGFGQGGKLTLDSGVEPQPDPGRELHVGDLVLRAFGSRQSDGRLVIATSDQSPTTTNSALRKLRVPGSQAVSNGAAIGTFGVVNGKKTKLTFTDDDGTVVTLTLTGGSGTVYKAGGKLRLVINAEGKGAALVLTGKGGDGRVNLSDVMVNGSLKSLTGKNADLSGTLSTTGSIGKLTLADIAGATIAAGGGSLASLTALSLDQAYVLSGAALGSDGKLGGTDADADTFNQGTIGTIKIKGNITASVIGAGLDPTDGVFLDGDDTVVGGKASAIKSVSARNIDDATKIVAGSIRSAASPRKIKAIDGDGRFLLM